MTKIGTLLAGLTGISVPALVAGIALAQEGAAAPPQGPPSTPSAATTGQISGTVMSPQKKPVRGVPVGLIPESGGFLHGTSTDGEGRYSLKSLAPGAYSVLVMDPGGNLLRKERVTARPLFRNLVDFVTEPVGSPVHQIPPASLSATEAPATLDLTATLLSVEDRPIPEGWILLWPVGVESPALRAMTDGEGRARLLRVPAGYYRIIGRALGHVTWSLGPLRLEGGRDMTFRLTLLPFALGEPENPLDLLVPLDPIPPEAFAKEP